jgi:tetratricopeptide (TPR) repeat protein
VLLGGAPLAARAQPRADASSDGTSRLHSETRAGKAADQPAEPPATGPHGAEARVAAAREHFEQGRAAYRAGRLKQALFELTRAHELAPSPELEFNLARVCERMGLADAAIRHYRGYLAQPDVPAGERAQIEAKIRALNELLERQQAQVKAPSRDALTAEARAFFERGQSLFRRGQYRAALEAFAAARRFVPLPELDYNLALASERIGRNAEAVDYYRAYLRAAKRPADEARVHSRIKALLASSSAPDGQLR